jgi:hypothetical protein
MGECLASQSLLAKGIAMVLPPPPGSRKARKHLSADALYALLGGSFGRIADLRCPGSPIPLADALMSAFAMFSLKDPSLLAFDQRRNDANLKALFGIGQIPSDTRMREILDPVDPEHLRAPFGDIFRQLQRGKALKPFVFYTGHYLLSLDGTGYFSSQKIHCAACQVKEHKNGKVTYEHQMLAAVIVHPDLKEVIPLAPEPIQKQDGSAKNDCERNAARRLLAKIRREHPRLPLIVVEDGLSSNGPHVRDLIANDMHFLLGVKPGDHEYLFQQVEAARRQGASPTLARREGGTTREVSWVWNVPLNESNPDLRVNFLEYREYDAQGKLLQHFTWITDLHITKGNVWWFVRGGRARWHIENETFNTMKNQGYHFEHNYGHGEQNLSVVFAMLMMLAFLVDQTQQLCCGLFRAVWKKLGSKRALWEKLRSHFYHFTFRSMRQLYEAMLYDLAKEVPLPIVNSS